MKNSNDSIGNRTRDLPACSTTPQPTAPPRAPLQHCTTFISLLVTYRFYVADVISLCYYVLTILEALPYLHTRVQVVENVIIFQFAMSIVIEVHSYLFP